VTVDYDATGGDEAEPDRKRRRRSGPIDYKALDEQLRAEQSQHSVSANSPTDNKTAVG
jgi:hypothetical protein